MKRPPIIPILSALLLSSEISAAPSQQLVLDIKGTSLQELMSLKITSLSKKSESFKRAAAAVYVITNDDLKRMGVTHIAEALRYAPGVEVSRIRANQWAISIRGFNSRSANKLLVMIDGRSIYSTLFSGVLWEEKDTLLEDIERIEIIRGPGGAIWGANAVNGVINIITRQGKKTLGTHIKIGSGIEERSSAQARTGWKTGANAYTRVYGKATHRDDGGTGPIEDDQSEMAQLGFRHDQKLAAKRSITIQGDIYQSRMGPDYQPDEAEAQEHHGGNLMLDLEIQETKTRGHSLLLYYDETALKVSNFIDRRNLINLDYQMRQQAGMHDIVWGAGYRYIRDDVDSPFIQPEKTDQEVYNAFVQDDIALTKKINLIIGTKYEYNNYTGDEWHPNIRTSYAYDKGTFWVSWSRAIRTPTRLEKDITSFNTDNFESETAKFTEFGWRTLLRNDIRIDTTLYYADYENLLSLEPDGIRNEISGQITGIELSANYQANEYWLLRMNYSHAEMNLGASSGSIAETQATATEDTLPRDQLQFMSFWDIDEHWQLNSFLRYVDQLESMGVDKYLVADLVLGWRGEQGVSWQLVGRHLGDREHPEWGDQYTEVESDIAFYIAMELD